MEEPESSDTEPGYEGEEDHGGEEGGEEAEGRLLGRQQAARRRVPCARAGEMSGRTAVQGGRIGILPACTAGSGRPCALGTTEAATCCSL